MGPLLHGLLLTCRHVAVIHLRLLLISSGVSPNRCGCSAALLTALSSSFTCRCHTPHAQQTPPQQAFVGTVTPVTLPVCAVIDAVPCTHTVAAPHTQRCMPSCSLCGADQRVATCSPWVEFSAVSSVHPHCRPQAARTCHLRDSQPSVTAAAMVLRSGLAAVRPWNLDMRDCSSCTCDTRKPGLVHCCSCPSRREGLSTAASTPPDPESPA